MNQNVTDAQIISLLHRGMSNTGIAQQIHCCKARVARIRRRLGIPNVPAQPLTLEQKWAARTRSVDGGHLEWTGGRQSTSGTPVMRYGDKLHTAAAIAFRIRTGREPQGYAYAECGFNHCVAPAHVDDEPARAKTRAALRYLTGLGERPAKCGQGHDQAVEGRYTPNGRSYCEACKRERRSEELAQRTRELTR
ncbi:hypothetical protein GCM10011583_11620 [Streptomyces camponoticapitis]|uniref:Uncharacterized protein n=1 Tax=Streptomyces camponoticapitis TaxID=1616125 RepID=A0ABQ2DZP3_9ACTN|nr:hypothetical protein [Streptomyces camponoticapitis]GGJ81840.1 hypothetical protein GCM10011583_11620 [Streptomyces camponoticapitis]